VDKFVEIVDKISSKWKIFAKKLSFCEIVVHFEAIM